MNNEQQLINAFEEMNLEEVDLGPGTLRFFQMKDLADSEIGLVERLSAMRPRPMHWDRDVQPIEISGKR